MLHEVGIYENLAGVYYIIGFSGFVRLKLEDLCENC